MGKQSNSCDSPSTNPPRTMISRSAIGPKAQLALRRQCCAHPANRRGLAASISGSTSFSYETADVNGVKVASRDVAGPTTKLAVVAKAGTRYQSAPGLTSGLEQFAFKNTLKRSALRITRESELLGGQLTAYHTREALVIEAKFLREDLPYFTELLGEVVSQTKYTAHEYHEEISPLSSLPRRSSWEMFPSLLSTLHMVWPFTEVSARLFTHHPRRLCPNT